MDRRDDYGNWQETGGHGDRWTYGSEQYEDDRVPAPRSPEPRYGGAPMSGPPMSGPPMSGPPMGGPPMRGPRPGEPVPPMDPLYDPLPDPRLGPGPVDPRLGQGQQMPPPPQQHMPPEPGYQQPTGVVDSAAVRRKIKETDGLYRSRKPIFIALYALMAAIGEGLMIGPFFKSIGEMAALSPLLAMLSFPVLAMGMYGLSTGAATAVQFQGPRVWLRLPLVYIPIGIGLLIAAGAAAN